MATLNIKNFPDPLYEKLKSRAKRERRSVAQEVIRLLSVTVDAPPQSSIMELEGLGEELWRGVDLSPREGRPRRRPGALRGKIRMAPDFDAMPSGIPDAMEGEKA